MDQNLLTYWETRDLTTPNPVEENNATHANKLANPEEDSPAGTDLFYTEPSASNAKIGVLMQNT